MQEWDARFKCSYWCLGETSRNRTEGNLQGSKNDVKEGNSVRGGKCSQFSGGKEVKISKKSNLSPEYFLKVCIMKLQL